MLDAPQRRRFISPAVLLAVLLCFFLPFFSVSCSSGVGQMKATVSGMDQVLGGEPEYSGFRPPPIGEDATAADEQKSQISPAALIGFAAIIIGVGLGLGLPRPRARWISGAAASGIALVAVVVNQVMIHRRAKEGLDQAASTFRDQLGNNPIFGQSIPMPAFELIDESGFWVVTVLLGLVVAYNVFEVVVLQRGPNGLSRLAADGAGAPQPPPLPLGSRQGVQQPARASASQASGPSPGVPLTSPLPQVPAGWYRDPHGQPCNRWWDGFQWTHNTSPLAQG
jgi:Protein of unknown function (DUF2510)